MQALLRRQFVHVESILDHCTGPTCLLTEKGVPGRLLKALEWLEGPRGWAILAAVVMPTHMHLVLRNNAGRSALLLDDLARFKNFSAREANKALGRSGALWVREEFDHWCRSPEKLESSIRYVRENAVKAGLAKTWQEWSWVR